MSRPKLKPEPIGKADLNSYLKTADSFQLEVNVFRSCEVAGFDATYAAIYQDPVTSQDRQYDVRAEFMEKNRVLRLAIECKALKTHFPLLVSRVPRDGREACHQVVLSSRSSGQIRLQVTATSFGQSFYRDQEFVGKSTAQVGRTPTGDITSNDEEVYSKLSQAIASSYDLVSVARSDCNRLDSQYKTCATTILPILVVANETLWAVDYGKSGEILEEPRPVNECTLYLGKNVTISDGELSINYKHTHLLIYTQQGFDAFLKKFSNSSDYRERIMLDPHDVRDMAKKAFGDNAI